MPPQAAELICLSVVLLVATAACTGRAVTAYTYQEIAGLGQTAPGGGSFDGLFETGQINNHGDIVFGSGYATDGVDYLGEAAFVVRHGQTEALGLPGAGAPGGGAFAGIVFSPPSLNDWGDAVAALQLAPFVTPYGMDAGLYRFSAALGEVRPVIVPELTRLPESGSVFRGVAFGPCINNQGQVLFTGLVDSTAGLLPSQGLGLGLYLLGVGGQIQKIVQPGDAAPGGGAFDLAELGWLNDAGDIVFGAHIAGEECIGDPALSQQSSRIFCGDNTYLRFADSGRIISIAHQGDPAPGGGTFRHAWGPIINNARTVLFVGDLSAPPENDLAQGLYLYDPSQGTTRPVVRPGDILPDGSRIVTVSDFATGHHLNLQGEVSFLAALGNGQEALWVKTARGLQMVAKTGQGLPGMGMVTSFDFAGAALIGGALNNDAGQVAFAANLGNRGAVIVLATPRQRLGGASRPSQDPSETGTTRGMPFSESQ